MENNGTKVTLKEYFEALVKTLKEFVFKTIDDNDKRYEQRFLSQEQAVAKAETAQTEYNKKSNEFRQSLDDANKINIARTEVFSLFKGVDEKINNLKINLEKSIDEAKSDIILLREFRSSEAGKEKYVVQDTGQRNWSIGIIVSIAFGLLGLTISLINMIKK